MPFFICLSSVELSVFDGLLTGNLGSTSIVPVRCHGFIQRMHI
jgi:hypothetical protein